VSTTTPPLDEVPLDLAGDPVPGQVPKPKNKGGRPKGCSCPKLPCPVHPDRKADPLEEWRAAIPGGGRPPDPKPTRRKRGKRRPTTPELEAVLAELLVLPAIPARGVLHCDFCMMHFLTEGPKAAHELAVLAEDNDALRRVLERIHSAMTAITWTAVIGSYVAKPVLHHVAPANVLEAVGPVIGVPPRPDPRHDGHGHNQEPDAATASSAPPAEFSAAA
jgi:hypothetical protein